MIHKDNDARRRIQNLPDDIDKDLEPNLPTKSATHPVESSVGAVGGALLTLFCFISLGVDGVTWALLGVALAQICTTLFFARRLPLVVIKQSWRETATISWRVLRQGGP